MLTRRVLWAHTSTSLSGGCVGNTVSVLESTGHKRTGRAYLEALPFLGPVRPDVEVLAVAVLVLCPLVQDEVHAPGLQ